MNATSYNYILIYFAEYVYFSENIKYAATAGERIDIYSILANTTRLLAVPSPNPYYI